MCVHVCYLLHCDDYQWLVRITCAFEQVFLDIYIGMKNRIKLLVSF